MARAAIKLLLLFGLYLLLVGQIATDEVVAAALCAGAAVALSLVISLIAGRHFSFRHVPWFHLLAATVRALIKQPVQVGWRLLGASPAPGTFERRPFAAAGTRPEDGTRRGLVTLVTSLTPNIYVLAVLTGRQELLVHSLVPDRHPQDRAWPL